MLFDVPGCSYSMIKQTEDVLKSIAWHLSSKKQCSGKVYRVAIGLKDEEQQSCIQLLHNNTDFSNVIMFDIDVTLKSHVGSRTHMMPVIQHILMQHFSDVVSDTHVIGNVCNIKPDSLVSGIYEYRPFASGKYRRWFRVD